MDHQRIVVTPNVSETRIQIQTSSGVMAGISWACDGHSGDQPALVFLHANGFCASTYRTLLSGVAQATRQRVIGLDLRGHGRSQLPANPDFQDNWNRHARDICEALADLAPDGCVLGGHSMASARRPELVRGMCLFDPVLAPSSFYLYAKLPWVFENWRRNFPMARAAGKRRAIFASRDQALKAYSGRGAFKSWPNQTIADYCEDGFLDREDGRVELACAPAFEAACFAGQRHNPHAALRHINWPAKLLRGGTRSTTAAMVIPKLRRSGFDVETLEGTSHFLPMERPDLCSSALIEVMAQAARPSVLAA
jgi:pimeloyl-ACP methyl ester carboxylesterase